MNKLTEEQKKLVEDNHKLIYSFIIKRNLSIDEWYDVLAYALCKAAATFNPEKAKFSTYVMKCMFNEYNMVLRSNNSNCRKANESALYYYDNIPLCNGGDDLIYLDVIEDKSCINVEDAVITKMSIQIYDKLTDLQKQVFKLTLFGYTQIEIAEILDYSQGYISRILKKIRKK